MAIADKLNELVIQRDNLANNLNTMGVSASTDETLSTLVPKVLDIETGSGGTEVEKGIIINAFDENGRATDIEIVGFTAIPSSYLYYAGYNGGWLATGSRVKIADGVVNTGPNTFERSKVTYVDLPPSLVVIGNSVFRESNLNSIDIPASVTRIDSSAFYSCTNLKQVILRAITPPTLGSNAFKNCPIGYTTPTGYIYVPDESVSVYQSATNWSTYASAIKPISELEG